MKRLFILCLLFAGLLPVGRLRAQMSVATNVHVGYAGMEEVGPALHLGLSTDFLPLPYIGLYLALEFYGMGDSNSGLEAEDTETVAHVSAVGSVDGLDASQRGGMSVAGSVGVVVNPVAIWLPQTPHLLNVRLDGGAVAYLVRRWDYNGSDRSRQFSYTSGYGWTAGVELSYAYRFGQLFSLGAYYQFRIMSQLTSSVGAVFALHFLSWADEAD